jgi:hypothetical protein
VKKVRTYYMVLVHKTYKHKCKYSERKQVSGTWEQEREGTYHKGAQGIF